MFRTARYVLLLLLPLLMLITAGCGGGSTNSAAASSATEAPAPANAKALMEALATIPAPMGGGSGMGGPYSGLWLESEPGDFIGEFYGRGASYYYTPAVAKFTIVPISKGLRIRIIGDEEWTGEFSFPDASEKVHPGIYLNAERYPFGTAGTPQMSWSGEGRGCNELIGAVAVDRIVYTGNEITQLELRFVQHCEGVAAALKGAFSWSAQGNPSPPGPRSIPANLWKPAEGIPASGNYIYLTSNGDFVGQGKNYLFTHENSRIDLSEQNGYLTLAIDDGTRWRGEFVRMEFLPYIQEGYYPNLKRASFHNPLKGGLDWTGDGRGCNKIRGWVAVDHVSYVNGTLNAIDYRFEQICSDGVNLLPLRGQIHWRASDVKLPPGLAAIPAGLWDAPTSAVPASGDFVYLESDPSDPVGGGTTYLYTPPSNVLTVSEYGNNGLHFWLNPWGGELIPMYSLSRVEAGYYQGLSSSYIYNPVHGGFSWTKGVCMTADSWVAVDEIRYHPAGFVTALTMRFEQHCEGSTGAMRGKIRWTSPY